jgi:hypothetical protein
MPNLCRRGSGEIDSKLGGWAMGMNVFDSEIGWKKRLAIVLSFLWIELPPKFRLPRDGV